ncbi:antA/AntB antirepressor family protein [Avibacterium sp. 21-595]|uniref:antA/AntB antirepressor family protein n=1 Tax=Avibacterium sp. 21-595 TaxID=2911527 RepID=UPI002025CD9B|nr:antA/AntB antirepressor family protein [Avibacterium sp. 21-595]URL05945.1 antA/AntB antirepressor family protein [Avibacterium sp. 21-595]
MTNSNLVAVFNGQIANQSVQLCNARDLHQFLTVKTQFGNWIKDRISDYGFIQDEDYIVTTERTAGRPRKEYYITLDMGKELGMVERNEKGRQIRRYFIECERRNKSAVMPSAPIIRPPLKLNAVQQSQLTALLNYVDYFTGEVYPALQTLFPKLNEAHYAQVSDMRILYLLLSKSTKLNQYRTSLK